MLSVDPEKNSRFRLQSHTPPVPGCHGPLVVHRLDMATSGLLLIAKTKEVHQNLQAQFSNRSIKKRYTALLEGIVSDEEGTIDLPLCLNPLDRPRQIVDKEHGKPAITHYRVLARTESQTLVAFYPLTGRTHQLRVHSATFLRTTLPYQRRRTLRQQGRQTLSARRVSGVYPSCQQGKSNYRGESRLYATVAAPTEGGTIRLILPYT